MTSGQPAGRGISGPPWRLVGHVRRRTPKPVHAVEAKSDAAGPGRADILRTDGKRHPPARRQRSRAGDALHARLAQAATTTPADAPTSPATRRARHSITVSARAAGPSPGRTGHETPSSGAHPAGRRCSHERRPARGEVRHSAVFLSRDSPFVRWRRRPAVKGDASRRACRAFRPSRPSRPSRSGRHHGAIARYIRRRRVATPGIRNAVLAVDQRTLGTQLNVNLTQSFFQLNHFSAELTLPLGALPVTALKSLDACFDELAAPVAYRLARDTGFPGRFRDGDPTGQDREYEFCFCLGRDSRRTCHDASFPYLWFQRPNHREPARA